MTLHLFCVIILVLAASETESILRKSEDELSKTFQTYEIIRPFEVDFEGNFVSFHLDSAGRRRRREIRDLKSSNFDNSNPDDGEYSNRRNNFYLNITAFGNNFSIALERKTRLIAPTATTFLYTGHNESTEIPVADDDVYAGYVTNKLGSTVALTNFEGLSGFLKTEDGEFFIEPIEERREETGGDFPQRHVIYKTYNRFGNQIIKTRSKRSRGRGKNYNIEVLLTADDTVVEFHGREHVQNYLVTLMNIVDEIYQDDSIGHNINVIIARLSLLSRIQSDDLVAREDPAASLKNVCKWAYKSHHLSSGNPKTTVYDHAIFLTRRNFGPMGMEGYAHVTGMCQPLRSCTLNHEDGFSSAFVVAHETGHVLGMEHDGEGNKCGDETSMGSIMAPLVQAAFHRYHWSRCSQYELKGNIRKFDCLLNNPHVPDWGDTQEYPGVYYSLDDQCRFDFGPGYKQCTAFRHFDVCQTLWCSHDDNPMFCKTKNGPPVDGTECAENMWCFKSHCVWRDLRHAEVDGGWGEWSRFGLCSRSCGAGVMTRTRECNRPRPTLGGNDCQGSRSEVQLCQTQPCTGSYDYRAEQCRFHQKKVYANRRHTWLPYESEHEELKCELYCMSKETNTILSMGMPAADGTRCSYDDPHSVCFGGECLKVGCDGVIGSTKREDECGVCQGDGSQCRRKEYNFRKTIRKPQNSYMKLFTIPVRARKVLIRETSSDLSVVIALKNRRTGRYILNQKGTISDHNEQRQIIDGGTKWSYVKKRDKEELRTNGPLKSEYVILAIQRKPVRRIKVQYSYVLHSDDVVDSMYEYEIRKWNSCSVTCGVGTKLARYGCRNKSSNRWVRKSYCGSNLPRRVRKPCSIDCGPETRWDTGRWGSCSVSCGGSGEKRRSVVCQRRGESDLWEAVGDSECLSTKPSVVKSCSRQTCPPEWSHGNWSACSVSCGKGLRRRQVICVVGGRTASDDECLGTRPVEAEPCEDEETCASETICERDQSMFCKLSSMSKYCSIAGYHQLCCESCRTRQEESEK